MLTRTDAWSLWRFDICLGRRASLESLPCVGASSFTSLHPLYVPVCSVSSERTVSSMLRRTLVELCSRLGVYLNAWSPSVCVCVCSLYTSRALGQAPSVSRETVCCSCAARWTWPLEFVPHTMTRHTHTRALTSHLTRRLVSSVPHDGHEVPVHDGLHPQTQCELDSISVKRDTFLTLLNSVYWLISPSWLC